MVDVRRLLPKAPKTGDMALIIHGSNRGAIVSVIRINGIDGSTKVSFDVKASSGDKSWSEILGNLTKIGEFD